MTTSLTAPKVWKFGDNIDTDLMLPGSHLWKSQEERRQAVFQANRPGWVDLVTPGDAMVLGRSFGIGSSRPASLSLKLCGISFALAESINGLFFRNCVNYGFKAFECPGCHDAFEEGDAIEVDISAWAVRNPRTGQVLDVVPVPDMPLSLMLGGGIVPMLEKQGLIAPLTPESEEAVARANAGGGHGH